MTGLPGDDLIWTRCLTVSIQCQGVMNGRTDGRTDAVIIIQSLRFIAAKRIACIIHLHICFHE